MLFRAEVEEAPEQFNPWMTTDAIRATVEKLEALAGYRGLARAIQGRTSGTVKNR